MRPGILAVFLLAGCATSPDSMTQSEREAVMAKHKAYWEAKAAEYAAKSPEEKAAEAQQRAAAAQCEYEASLHTDSSLGDDSRVDRMVSAIEQSNRRAELLALCLKAKGG